MHIVKIDSAADTADAADRVTPRLLLGPGDEGCAHLAAVRIEVPAGARMARHAHGDSETLLTVLDGAAVVRSGAASRKLSPGVLAHVGVGEQVEVHNTGDQSATLLAIFSPPEFAARLPR